MTEVGESFTAYLYRDDESPRCPVCGVGPYESFSLSGMGTGPSVQTFQPCGCARSVTVIAEPEGLAIADNPATGGSMITDVQSTAGPDD